MEGMVILRKLGGEGVRILLVEIKLVERKRNQHHAEDQAPGPSPRLRKTRAGGLGAQEEPGLAVTKIFAFTLVYLGGSPSVLLLAVVGKEG